MCSTISARSEVPVHEGLARPLVRADFPIPRRVDDRAGKFHGKTLPLPEPKSAKRTTGAVEFLIETYRNTTDEITLVPVAPLTNIAAALTLYPKLAELVPEVVIMGGGHAVGNVTPSAEFNIWADPEAAAVVFSAGFRKLTLVPLDATHRALVSRDDCAALGALGTPAGQAAATSSAAASRRTMHRRRWASRIRRRSMTRSAWPRSSIRSLITTRRLHVAVETTGALTMGRTVIDTHFRGGGEPQCDVAFDADAKRFVAMLTETFA